MTQILSTAEMIALIKKRQPFTARAADSSFEIKIEDYSGYLGTAIHHGHQIGDAYKALCALDDNQRYHEEDPYTGDMLAGPITITALDSRYEYDLNRSPEICIHENAWGKEVWTSPLSQDLKDKAVAKHTQFYQVVTALVETLLNIHPYCLVYDVHSYNILDRDYKNPPMFNIGTHFVDEARFQPVVDDWMDKLRSIKIPSVENEVKANEVYFGKGYLAQKLMADFSNCLVLATEVKKIYADENQPIRHEPIIQAIHDGFERLMPQTAKLLLEGSY